MKLIAILIALLCTPAFASAPAGWPNDIHVGITSGTIAGTYDLQWSGTEYTTPGAMLMSLDYGPTSGRPVDLLIGSWDGSLSIDPSTPEGFSIAFIGWSGGGVEDAPGVPTFAVPEASSLALLAVGCLGLMQRRVK